MTGDFPKLTTARLLLRAFGPADADGVFGTYADDEVTRYYDLPTFERREQAVELVERFAARFPGGTGIRWAVERRADGAYLGDVGLQWRPAPRIAELGYALTREAWGRGYAGEAVGAAVAWAFAHFDGLRINRIEAGTDPANEASMRVLSRNGFTREGLLREREYEKGRFVDVVLFSLLRREWEAARERAPR